MKLILCSLALFLAASAMPASATDTRMDYDYFVQKVDAAQAAWEADRPTESYWQDIKSSLPAWTDARTEQRARLERAIDDLIQRAKNANLILCDFWRMKGMVVDCKCSTATRELWKLATLRKATRQQFEHVASLYHERAEAAKEHMDMRAVVQEEILKLTKKYFAGEELTLLQTSYFDDEAVRSMLDRAVAWLEDMAISRHATREQFEYVRDLMKDRARIWSENLEVAALVRRVDAELDRLMSGPFRTASFDRDDFLKLREMCLRKAREFVTGLGATG
jgi:vacuolar-type H+-ATPase subunit I/STV1